MPENRQPSLSTCWGRGGKGFFSISGVGRQERPRRAGGRRGAAGLPAGRPPQACARSAPPRPESALRPPRPARPGPRRGRVSTCRCRTDRPGTGERRAAPIARAPAEGNKFRRACLARWEHVF